MQAWTRNSSVSSQVLYHRATAPPLLFEENAFSFINPVIPDKIVYTGLLVISCCFFGVFFVVIFYSKLC